MLQNFPVYFSFSNQTLSQCLHHLRKNPSLKPKPKTTPGEILHFRAYILFAPDLRKLEDDLTKLKLEQSLTKLEQELLQYFANVQEYVQSCKGKSTLSLEDLGFICLRIWSTKPSLSKRNYNPRSQMPPSDSNTAQFDKLIATLGDLGGLLGSRETRGPGFCHSTGFEFFDKQSRKYKNFVILFRNEFDVWYIQ